MSTKIIRTGSPECPLCRNRMREIVTKQGTFGVCTRELCMISCNVKDPVYGKWRDKEEKVCPPCQFCQKPMRTFFRSDGLVITRCRDKSHRFYQIAKGKVEDLPPEMGGESRG